MESASLYPLPLLNKLYTTGVENGSAIHFSLSNETQWKESALLKRIFPPRPQRYVKRPPNISLRIKVFFGKQSARKRSSLISNRSRFKALLNKTSGSKQEPQSWFHVAGHSISFPMLIKVMVMQRGGNGSQSPHPLRPKPERWLWMSVCFCVVLIFFKIFFAAVILSSRPNLRLGSYVPLSRQSDGVRGIFPVVRARLSDQPSRGNFRGEI